MRGIRVDFSECLCQLNCFAERAFGFLLCFSSLSVVLMMDTFFSPFFPFLERELKSLFSLLRFSTKVRPLHAEN